MKVCLFTGNQLRHERFARLLKIRFADYEINWYCNENKKPEGNSNFFKREYIKFIDTYFNQSYSKRITKAEIRLIQDEVVKLRNQTRELDFSKVDYTIINSMEFINSIAKINPDIIISFGGPLYPKKLIMLAKHFAINQHAGKAPELKGANTIEWALFHRKLEWVGSTVHLLESSADSGSIYRFGNTTILKDDNLEDIFLRSTFLGNDIIFELLNDIRAGKVPTFTEQSNEGQTKLSKDYTHAIHLDLVNEVKNGLIGKLLNLRIKC